MEKLKNLLVILLFILSITFLLFSILLTPINNLAKNDKNDVKENEESYIENLNAQVEDTVYISNMNDLFSKYTGELTRLEVSKFIRNIALTEIYNLKTGELNQRYFDNNKEQIKNIYGITKYEDFYNLYVSVMDYEQNVNNILIIGNSVKVENDVTKFNIKIVFQSKKEMEFQCIINNVVSNDKANIVFLSK